MNDANDNPIGAIVATTITVAGSNLEQTQLGSEVKHLIDEVNRERDLTKLLGVSLRGVLPYAQAELENLSGAYQKDADPDVKDELNRCSVRVQRAQQALQHLDDSPLSIINNMDHDFDDAFKIVFEDDE